jgi:hypothetical protein
MKGEVRMKRHEEEHEREILREAFVAGWQAALGRVVTNPAVLAVIETCFEQWLIEAADEAEVLGLMFRGRYDLPGSVLKDPALAADFPLGQRPTAVPAQPQTRPPRSALTRHLPERPTVSASSRDGDSR